jgi:hypothetical protein
METSPAGEYRDQQVDNLEGVIAYIFNYKGALEIWEEAKHTFVPIQALFEKAISDAQGSYISMVDRPLLAESSRSQGLG